MAAFRSLLSEAKALQSLVKDLHGKLDPKTLPLTVPSWLFPGKSAIEVDFEGLLKEVSTEQAASPKAGPPNHETQRRLRILELIMDRLLLTVQLILVLSNNTSSRSSVIPLTFGTVFKKLSKKVIVKHNEGHRIQLPPTTSGDAQTTSGCGLRSNTNDVSTQTIQTNFSICKDCDIKNDTIACLAQTLGSQCITVCGRSSLSQKNWKQMIETGCLQVKDLRDRFEQDLLMIMEVHNRLNSTCEVKNELIDKQSTCLSTLEEESNLLQEQIASLDKQLQQQKVEAEAERKTMSNKHNERLKEVKEKLESKITKCQLLTNEISHLKQLEYELKGKLAANVTLIEQISAEKDALQTDEAQLRSMNSEFSDSIKRLKLQLQQKEQTCEQIQNNIKSVSMEMNKYQTLEATISKRYKRLNSEHNGLIERYTALDDKCNELLSEIVELQKEKEICQQEIIKMRGTIENCKAELAAEKENTSIAIGENTELQTELITINKQLKEQLKNHQLLMDYPFTNDIKSIKDHDKCVRANNVRILLLEQQNLQLREVIHSQIPYKPHPTPVKLDHPVKLWTSIDSKDKRSRNGRPGGKVGQIKRALSTAQYLNEQQRIGSPLEAFPCSCCDHVFFSKSHLDSHVCDIENSLLL